MRLKLTLETTNNYNSNVLPLNYQYELSSWIYKIINFGNPDFADWLHKQGYTNEKKQFKLFTFSNLQINKYKIDKDRLIMQSNNAKLIVSFLPVKSLETFVTGLFRNQEFKLGDKNSNVDFTVRTVETMPEPEFSGEMKFRTLSPIHITQHNPYDESKVDHLNPHHKDFEKLFFKNLFDKYNAFHKPTDFKTDDCTLQILSEPRGKLITLKANTARETKHKAYLFDFKIKAHPELIHVGYYAGYGKSNSQGFGCVEDLKKCF